MSKKTQYSEDTVPDTDDEYENQLVRQVLNESETSSRGREVSRYENARNTAPKATVSHGRRASFIENRDDVWLSNGQSRRMIPTEDNYCTNHGNAVIPMVENFNELFCTAFTDQRTTDRMTQSLLPMLTSTIKDTMKDTLKDAMKDHTKAITEEIRGLKGEITAQQEEIKQLSTKVEGLEVKCNTQNDDIKAMSDTIFQQQIFIENVNKDKRINNLVITGIPQAQGLNQENIEKKTIEIIESIGINREEIHPISIRRLNNTDNQTAVVKMSLPNRDEKKRIKENAKNLKNSATFKRVFIKDDKTPLASKEDTRLRQKKRQLAADNPGADIRMDKGALIMNGQKLDEFNLRNQLFRAQRQ